MNLMIILMKRFDITFLTFSVANSLLKIQQIYCFDWNGEFFLLGKNIVHLIFGTWIVWIFCAALDWAEKWVEKNGGDNELRWLNYKNKFIIFEMSIGT